MLSTNVVSLAATLACACSSALAAPTPDSNITSIDSAELTARKVIGPTQQGFIPFVHPARCHTNNIYCLTVQTSRGDPHPFRNVYGNVSWIEGGDGDNWGTVAFNGQFRGTLPVNCGAAGFQDVDIWFGIVKGWSNMSTSTPFVEGRTSDGKMMIPGLHGGAVGSGTPWVDFAVWCVDA